MPLHLSRVQANLRRYEADFLGGAKDLDTRRFLNSIVSQGARFRGGGSQEDWRRVLTRIVDHDGQFTATNEFERAVLTEYTKSGPAVQAVLADPGLAFVDLYDDFAKNGVQTSVIDAWLYHFTRRDSHTLLGVLNRLADEELDEAARNLANAIEPGRIFELWTPENLKMFPLPLQTEYAKNASKILRSTNLWTQWVETHRPVLLKKLLGTPDMTPEIRADFNAIYTPELVDDAAVEVAARRDIQRVLRTGDREKIIQVASKYPTLFKPVETEFYTAASAKKGALVAAVRAHLANGESDSLHILTVKHGDRVIDDIELDFMEHVAAVKQEFPIENQARRAQLVKKHTELVVRFAEQQAVAAYHKFPMYNLSVRNGRVALELGFPLAWVESVNTTAIRVMKDFPIKSPRHRARLVQKYGEAWVLEMTERMKRLEGELPITDRAHYTELVAQYTSRWVNHVVPDWTDPGVAEATLVDELPIRDPGHRAALARQYTEQAVADLEYAYNLVYTGIVNGQLGRALVESHDREVVAIAMREFAAAARRSGKHGLNPNAHPCQLTMDIMKMTNGRGAADRQESEWV